MNKELRTISLLTNFTELCLYSKVVSPPVFIFIILFAFVRYVWIVCFCVRLLCPFGCIISSGLVILRIWVYILIIMVRESIYFYNYFRRFFNIYNCFVNLISVSFCSPVQIIQTASHSCCFLSLGFNFFYPILPTCSVYAQVVKFHQVMDVSHWYFFIFY